MLDKWLSDFWRTFSILERIDVGETQQPWLLSYDVAPFSILERIDVGETRGVVIMSGAFRSSFQYPRTDRRG